MQLVVDIGNSRSKLALFQDGELLRHASRSSSELIELDSFLEEEKPDAAIWSSVRNEWPADMNDQASFAAPLLLGHHTPLPISVELNDPRSIGTDRLANAVAAFWNWPDRPVLVIDMGTCITYDRVDAGRLIGGAISPGVRMRADAMDRSTGKLPHVDLDRKPEPIGLDTSESLRSGIYYGVLYEIKGWIEAFEKDQKKGVVVLTGGDASLVGNAFKKGIFADPFLTLRGLDAILQAHRESSDHAAPSDHPH